MIPLDDEPAILGAPSSRAVDESARRRRRRRAADAAETKVARKAVPLGKYSDIVYVWEPHRPELPPLRPYLSSLWARRHLMHAMSHADLRSRESRTFLGRIWWLLDPLVQAAIFYMVYALISGAHSTAILPRLVTSIFLFNLATVSMGEGGNSIRQNRGLLLNSDFPRAMLPLSTIYKGLARFWPSIPVAAVVCLAFDAPLGASLVLVPVLFAFQIVLMIGMALFTSAATVFVPDAQNIINYLTRIFFFSTPIIWSVDSISGNLKTVLAFQPFFALFASYQTIILGDWPSWRMLAPIPVWTIAMFLIGAWVFVRREREFAVRL